MPAANRQPCDSYCEHGGVCVFDLGHGGLHSSKYCEWDDAHALTADEADEILIASDPVLGPTIASLDRSMRAVLAND